MQSSTHTRSITHMHAITLYMYVLNIVSALAFARGLKKGWL